MLSDFSVDPQSGIHKKQPIKLATTKNFDKHRRIVVIKQSIQLTISTCILALTCYVGNVFGHGKVSLEDDICVRMAGGNMVHLSTYQPQLDLNGQYCTEIPTEGETYLVVDLLDSALRNMPVSLKVFRGSSENGETVAQLNADYYSDGVINGVGKLDKGLYSVVVTAEGIPPLSYHYQLRVAMLDYGKVARSLLGPVIVILILSWITYRFLQSKRIRFPFNLRK